MTTSELVKRLQTGPNLEMGPRTEIEYIVVTTEGRLVVAEVSPNTAGEMIMILQSIVRSAK